MVGSAKAACSRSAPSGQTITSLSTNHSTSPAASPAARLRATPGPPFTGVTRTRAPMSRATSAVRSGERSSTTNTSTTSPRGLTVKTMAHSLSSGRLPG